MAISAIFSTPSAPKLIVSLGALPVVEVALRPGRLVIGSEPSADLLLPLPDVAARHAELELTPDDGRVTLRALAGGPIWINGGLVEAAVLGESDVALLGSYTLRVGAGGSSAGSRGTTMGTEDGVTNGAPASPIAWLRVIAGPDAGAAVPFEKSALTIGRAPDGELVLRDPRVSWRHVALERTAEGVRVCDLGSRNGTFLAHNAGFDRPFAERICPAFAGKPWACSMSQIPWEAEGVAGSKRA